MLKILIVEDDRELRQLFAHVLIKNGYRADGVSNGREALDAIRFAWENGKYVAAICAGPTILADLGITENLQATCYPGCGGGMGNARLVPGAAAVSDGRVITGTSAGCAVPFALALIAALKGEEAAKHVADQIVIR